MSNKYLSKKKKRDSKEIRDNSACGDDRTLRPETFSHPNKGKEKNGTLIDRPHRHIRKKK